MPAYRFPRSLKIQLLASSLILSNAVQAEWSTGGDFSTYYTDDVGLFSVTRRLSLEEDPTQPIVDEPNQGSDAVYEPNVYINWDIENTLGEFQVSLDGGGYIFQNHSDYTHGFMQFSIAQEFVSNTTIKLLYDYIPNLFLGTHSPPQIEHITTDKHNELEIDERLDNHILTMLLEQEINDQFILHGLVRYGARLYDEPFSYRDIQFFTIGPRLQWTINPNVVLLVGYHFERGYTDPSETVQYQDDIGYINHFASAELKIHILPELILMAIFDYEHNDYTSPYEDDIHHNGNENVFQGELELIYEVTEAAALKVGWQHGNRKFSYELESVRNNNVWIGAEYHF
mgnify:CR=1 FL=1